MDIPASALDILEAPTLAHLATIGSDGRPHVTCAWVGVEDGDLAIATLFDQTKLKNMRNDPRVTLSFETDETHNGLTKYLVIYGNARVTEGGAPELLQKLAFTYIGPDVKFPPMPDPPPGFVTRISVERLAGVGPWKD